jgi:hypothetical protein
MAATKKTWLWILLGVVGVVCVLAIAAVGLSVYFVASHIETEQADRRTAGERFSTARERFAGMTPLIAVSDSGRATIQRPGEGTGSGRPLTTLRVLVYDDNDGRLVSMNIPFWLVRRMPGRRLSLPNGTGVSFDSEDGVRLSTADLERLGPALILDQRDTRGAQILVWTE